MKNLFLMIDVSAPLNICTAKWYDLAPKKFFLMLALATRSGVHLFDHLLWPLFPLSFF